MNLVSGVLEADPVGSLPLPRHHRRGGKAVTIWYDSSMKLAAAFLGLCLCGCGSSTDLLAPESSDPADGSGGAAPPDDCGLGGALLAQEARQALICEGLLREDATLLAFEAENLNATGIQMGRSNIWGFLVIDLGATTATQLVINNVFTDGLAARETNVAVPPACRDSVGLTWPGSAKLQQEGTARLAEPNIELVSIRLDGRAPCLQPTLDALSGVFVSARFLPPHGRFALFSPTGDFLRVCGPCDAYRPEDCSSCL